MPTRYFTLLMFALGIFAFSCQKADTTSLKTSGRNAIVIDSHKHVIPPLMLTITQPPYRLGWDTYMGTLHHTYCNYYGNHRVSDYNPYYFSVNRQDTGIIEFYGTFITADSGNYAFKYSFPYTPSGNYVQVFNYAEKISATIQNRSMSILYTHMSSFTCEAWQEDSNYFVGTLQ